MCKFKSGIVLKNGDLLHNPWTESHEDLVRLFKLKDTAAVNGEPRFARVEFSPASMATADDVSTYKLIIDENRCPEWFDEALKTKTAERMSLIVQNMIITGDADLLCGGVYILAKNARISCIKKAIIHVMLGSSKVGEMWESSKVGEMWESSKVGEMRDSSNVGENNSENKTPKKK